MSVRSRLHAVLGNGSNDTRQNPNLEEEAQDPKTEGEDEIKGDSVSLFECPSCETVYLAIEKTRCSQCDVAFDTAQAAPSPDTGME